MRAALRRAITMEDVALLGRVATASARINQRFLPKPSLEFLVEVCQRHGGCGVQVAHSGTVVGLIFDSSPPRTGSGDIAAGTSAGTAAGLRPAPGIRPGGSTNEAPAKVTAS